MSWHCACARSISQPTPVQVPQADADPEARDPARAAGERPDVRGADGVWQDVRAVGGVLAESVAARAPQKSFQISLHFCPNLG